MKGTYQLTLHLIFFPPKITIKKLCIWNRQVNASWDFRFRLKLFASSQKKVYEDISALQMKGRWESNINVCFQFRYSQKWNCVASLFPKQNYNVLSPNFHIHVSVSDLCIPRIGLPFLLHSQIHRNWERRRTVSFLGIHKSDFRYNVESVYCLVVSSKKHVANIGWRHAVLLSPGGKKLLPFHLLAVRWQLAALGQTIDQRLSFSVVLELLRTKGAV